MAQGDVSTLSYLRQTYHALTVTVGDVDLTTLYRGGNPPNLARVVKAIAVPMVRFGQQVQLQEDAIRSDRRSTTLMIVMLWGIALLVTYIVYKFIRAFVKKYGADEAAELTRMCGYAIVAALTLYTFLAAWGLVLGERLRRLQLNEVLLQNLRRVRANVSAMMMVRHSWAQQTGVMTEMVSETITAQTDGEGVAEACRVDSDVTSTTQYGLNLCDLPKMSLEQVARAEQTSNAAGVETMLKELQGIKVDGVHPFDRRLLWRDISDGVDAVRAEVYTAYDTASTPKPLERGAARDVLSKELLPLLRLPAVEVRDLVPAPDQLPAADPRYHDRDACWAACLADPAVRWAFWDGNGNCYLGRRAGGTPVFNRLVDPPRGDVGSSLLVKAEEVGSGKGVVDTVFVCNPAGIAQQTLQGLKPLSAVVAEKGVARSSAKVGTPAWCAAQVVQGENGRCDVVATGGRAWTLVYGAESYLDAFGGGAQRGPIVETAQGFCLRTTLGAIFAANAANLASTFSDLQPHTVSSIFSLCSKYNYQFKPAAYRSAIDAALTDHYGAQYDVAIRQVVDTVLASVDDLITEHLANAAKYIAPQRMLDKFRATSAADWKSLTVAVTDMNKATATFRASYPPYQSQLTAGLVTLVTSLAAVAAMVWLIMFILGNYFAIKTGSVDYVMRLSAVRAIIVAGCTYAVLIVIAATLCSKQTARIYHNLAVVDANGQTLVASMGELALADAALRASPSGQTATAYLDAAKAVTEAYDRCNVVTYGQLDPPFPTIEVAVYAVIAMCFLVAGVYTVGRLDPQGKVANIRQLLTLKKQLVNGERASGSGIDKLVECCRPPVAIWETLTWFAVFVLFCITVFFIFTSSDSVAAYVGSLNMSADCVD
jgi:hypothetical protein